MTTRATSPCLCTTLSLTLLAACLPWGKATSCESQHWYADQDEDGFGSPDEAISTCDRPNGYVADGSDCDDDDGAISPAGVEICDLVDNDCNGLIDDDSVDATPWYADNDGDGFGDGTSYSVSCQPEDGYVQESTDCNDEDAGVAPGEPEVCGDGVDQNCSGGSDEERSTCADSLLDCSESAFECITATSRESTCMCACDGGARLEWEVGGVLADRESSPLRGVIMDFETSAGSSGWVSCPDEVLNLPEDILPHAFEVDDITITIEMPCEDESGSLAQWYTNYYDGKIDRRTMSLIYLVYDDWSSYPTEEFRWNFYESLLIDYTPMPPCSGTSELTIYAERAEPA